MNDEQERPARNKKPQYGSFLPNTSRMACVST